MLQRLLFCENLSNGHAVRETLYPRNIPAIYGTYRTLKPNCGTFLTVVHFGAGVCSFTTSTDEL